MAGYEGKTVLITGANGGLGTAVTRAFLDCGATVVGVFRGGDSPAPGQARFSGGDADLTDPREAARVAQLAGKVDALIHLVGGFAGGQPVERTDDATWTSMMNLNLNAAFHMIRAVLPGMRAAGRGRIVAIGSRTALEPAANLSAYGVSKAALVALIRTVALELRGTGITANALLPSVIDTPANRAANPGADFSRWVTPESIAAALLWLASEDAAAINGAAIPIYGAA